MALHVALAAFLPLRSHAQTCTLNGATPYTSSTPLATISSDINAANPDSDPVACLARGETWSGPDGFALSQSFTNGHRVTICAATGSSCSSTGGANPVISITEPVGGVNQPVGKCVYAQANSSGYAFKNIDCINSSGASTGVALWIERSTSHYSWDGGVIRNFHGAITNSAWGQDPGMELPDDFQLGTNCANRVEVTGNSIGVSGLRSASYFACTNCGMRLWIHDFAGNDPEQHPDQNHLIDFPLKDAGGHDFTLECSLIQYSAGYMGSLVKLAKVDNVLIQDNVFEVTAAPNGGAAIALDDHGAGPEGDVGVVIRRNKLTGSYRMVIVGVGANVDVYDNVLIDDSTEGASSAGGLVQFWYTIGQADDVQLSDVQIFNNTVYRLNSSPDDGTGWSALFSVNFGGVNEGRTRCTDCGLANNLIYDLDTHAKAFGLNSICSEFGVDAVNVKNNFIYTPNDPDPLVPLVTDCAGDSGNTVANFTTNDPLLVSPPTDLKPQDVGSPVFKRGDAAYCPVTDHAGIRRPSPCSIGAFEPDSDGDSITDDLDDCPTIANPTQADRDADGVGDVCDNCVSVANPRVNLALLANCSNGGLCWATLTGGQRDDDHDGYGNKCDADFTPTRGLNVGTLDKAQLDASIGKSRLTDTCGTTANLPCAIFDLDEGIGLNIGTPDKLRFAALVGLPAGGVAPAGAGKCPSCPLACVAGMNGSCN